MMSINKFERVFQEERTSSVPAQKARKDRPTVDYGFDPRSDLVEDHPFWVAVLLAARKVATGLGGNDVLISTEQHTKNQALYEVLLGLRCGGARLARDGRTGFRIEPGEWTRADYAVMREEHLMPLAKEIKMVLRQAVWDIVEAKKAAQRAERGAALPTPKPTAAQPQLAQVPMQLSAPLKKEAV